MPSPSLVKTKLPTFFFITVSVTPLCSYIRARLTRLFAGFLKKMNSWYPKLQLIRFIWLPLSHYLPSGSTNSVF